MAENVKRINVTLPVKVYNRVKVIVEREPERYPSVSAYVAEAVNEHIEGDDAWELLLDMLDDGTEPTEEERAWVAGAFAAMEEAARRHQERNGAA